MGTPLRKPARQCRPGPGRLHNAQESVAGTNPNDPNSKPPRLSISPLPGSLARFDWESITGKSYSILSRPAVGSGPWATNISTTISINDAARFFKLSVEDIDTDADGLTDWEERALGFDPATAHSARQDGTDLQSVNVLWTTPNVITIATLDPNLSERWNEPGLVAIRRKGNFAPLTINIALSGSATLGADYTVTNATSITLPLGARETWIEFHPVADANDSEPPEDIVITILPGTGYTVGASNGAVQGRRIFGSYPSLALNPDQGSELNPLDTGRGRFIPTTSCDLFFAELALWLGVNKSDLPQILPNIGNFYNTSSASHPIGFLA